MPRVRDLTNAVSTESPAISGATPSSPGNYYQRRIGAGFFTEWGKMVDYSSVGFNDVYWTSDPSGSRQFTVATYNGDAYSSGSSYPYYGLCSHP